MYSDLAFRFPEIIAEIESKQKDDNYHESSIWPGKNGYVPRKRFLRSSIPICFRKHELQQVRIWMKSLPTYSIPLTDGAWCVLDVPIINEIDKSVQSFYAVNHFSTLSF